MLNGVERKLPVHGCALRSGPERYVKNTLPLRDAPQFSRCSVRDDSGRTLPAFSMDCRGRQAQRLTHAYRPTTQHPDRERRRIRLPRDSLQKG